MAKGIDVVATLGFDDSKPVGRVQLFGVDPAILATSVLSPVVKVTPSGAVKIIEYGIIPMGQVPSVSAMKRKLREGGADLS